MYIYTSKDGRQRAVYKNDNGVYHTVSYPRVLMEEKLGRKLESYEKVHHKDENRGNNDIDNLEVLLHGEHQRYHGFKQERKHHFEDKIVLCDYCGREFLWTANKQETYYYNMRKPSKHSSGKVFCSKK